APGGCFGRAGHMVRVRLYSLAADAALADGWRAFLEKAEVECVLPEGECGAGIGALLLAQAPDTVLEWARNKVGDELARLIVLLPSACLGGPGGAWRLRRAGAAEVLAYDGAHARETAVARLRRWQAVDDRLAAPPLCDEIVGRSPAFLALLRGLVEVAAFTTASILLLGESGTGKEQLA